MGADVRASKIKLDEFIIFKRLGKDPAEYPDAKSQPHVQVALKMKAKGGNARAGDVIPYIFCVGETTETGKTAQAERARHPDELRKAGSDCKIGAAHPVVRSIRSICSVDPTDYQHYLSQQILPPIERLCEPIEGTDRARLAECLGMSYAGMVVVVEADNSCRAGPRSLPHKCSRRSR